MKRTLSLKREALTSLTTDEMAAFGAAGDPDPTPPVFAPRTLQPRECLGTTGNSVLVCSDGCTMYGSACHC